ncbi:MAG: hypothetical protein JWO90_3196 [Solirubrobacterales bacterium]|nr:hypothetical protein [Solirubrobacterales bacterium]
MRRLLLAPLTATVIALAGCGDDGEDTASVATPAAPAASAPAETPAPEAEAPAAGDRVEIGMKGLQFEPKDVTVQAGTTVTWQNNEDIPHNVVAEEGADFESDTFGRDGTFEFTPEEAGTIAYVCTLHPGMEGTLTVEG